VPGVSRAELDDDEATFQAKVVQLAHACGWESNHTRRSIGKGHKWTTATSVVGWPDLVIYSPRRGRTLYRELKSESGRVTPEQAEVLADLAASGNDVAVWRPSDWPEIEATLTRRD
jgi:hypothetical protein